VEKRYWLPGEPGFPGSQVVAELYRRGVPVDQVIIPRSREYDLRIRSECDRVMTGVDIVIHLAARVGGLDITRHITDELFYDNLTWGHN
jgi:GDP-L-fucose synthase